MGTLAVGGVGSVAIAYLNASIEDAVGNARERAAIAANARLSIIGIDRAQARLVAAQTPDEIRREVVAAIRAASYLDESLQTLEKTLAGKDACWKRDRGGTDQVESGSHFLTHDYHQGR